MISIVDLALVHCPSHKFCTACVCDDFPAVAGSNVAQDGIVDMLFRSITAKGEEEEDSADNDDVLRNREQCTTGDFMNALRSVLDNISFCVLVFFLRERIQNR